VSVDKILANWKKNEFKPVYWLEGEEEYYINQLVEFAEHNILSEADKGFNLTIFYGKDADWSNVVNTCCRYPMFAARQVVLLKEAQQMKDIDKLEPYIVKPLSSTIFIVAYKDKKLDGRSKLAKFLKETDQVLSTKKLYDNQLPDWVTEMVRSKGYQINNKALFLLIDHVGNDLSRLDHEIEKTLVNLGNRKHITEDDIELYVGVSKEYNVFELQDALAKKDISKALKIISYFESNPKAAPIQLLLPTLYNFFSKTYMLFGQKGNDDQDVAANLGVRPMFVRDYMTAAKNYHYEGIENALLILHQYNLKSVGVNTVATEDGSLLKEMLVKILM